MKKEEIHVVIDDEQKRLRNMPILTDAGEPTWKEKVMNGFFLNFKSRNQYYVQLKAHVSIILYKQGYTYWQISEIIGNKEHGSVYHYIHNRKSNPDVESIVAENFEQWIISGLYPEKSISSRHGYILRVVENGKLKVTDYLDEFLQKTHNVFLTKTQLHNLREIVKREFLIE